MSLSLLQEITKMIQEQFKLAMGRFATGVCVVTFLDEKGGEIDGVTISAFSSVSLDPLKILFCLGNFGVNYQKMEKISRFAVNILSSEQTDLAYQFAGQNRDGLSGVADKRASVPILRDALATLICDKGNIHSEGDHNIIIGEVKEIILGDDNLQPLLYFKSQMIEDYQHV